MVEHLCVFELVLYLAHELFLEVAAVLLLFVVSQYLHELFWGLDLAEHVVQSVVVLFTVFEVIESMVR